MKLHLKLRFLASTLAALALSLAALPALAAPGPGAVDPAFNGGTPAIIDYNPCCAGNLQPFAAAMNPLNGDILWAGYYQSSGARSGVIAAYNPDGTVDPAVGGSGRIGLIADQAGFPGGSLYLSAIAVDSQGRILAAGEVEDAGETTNAMVLARFKPDGLLDTGFGAAGTGIVVAPLNNDAIGNGLSLTADGHILVTGNAYNAGHTEKRLTVWRFNPDGTPDTAFGSNGHVQIAAVNGAYWWCFPALQPDGTLIAGCDESTAGSWKLTRLKANGTVDTGFGTSGYLTSAANRQLTGLAPAPDGGFVISEVDTTTSPYPLDMRRFLAAGTVDPGFNSGNPLTLGSVPSGTWVVPVAVQPDGKILLSIINDGGTGLAIVRLLADGTADPGFGNISLPGVSDIDFTGIGGYNYTPSATALLLQGDGRIVASGWADSTAGSGKAGFVTRVLSDTYDLTPTTPAFTAVARAPLGQAVASNAVTVSGVSIGGATSGFSLALVTRNGKYSTSGGAPFTGDFTATNLAWVPAGSQLALEQMTPTIGGTATTTTVILGGFWAANNYEVPLGSPATADWTTTTDQPPVASDGTLSATTAKATTGTLSATNPSSGTLAFAIVTAPAHGTATVTASTGAYSYTSTGGYTGSDAFTWKVNDGVADSNIATVSVTVNAAPPPPPPPSGGGGGGSFGPFALLGLLFLALVPWWLRHRALRSTSTQPTEDTPMKPHVKLRFPVSTLAALAFGFLALPALATPTTAAARGIGSAPAALVAAIARTQAPEAAQNPAYAIGINGCAQLGARNNAAVLTGCFAKIGPAFSTGKQTLRLRLSAWGRAGKLQPVSLTRTAPRANRIEYRGRHIAEWWRVLPLGYEQGFTIEQAPTGTGKVVLQLNASRAPKIVHGTLTWGTLRYGKLHVSDANGKVLPATLSAQGKTITLAFDAARARYPVRVDPLVWVQQEVTAADGAAGDRFGYSVALAANGTTALVGALNKAVGTNSGQGAAYVYTLAGGTWSQTAELTAADGAANDSFGFSVALAADGTTALVGALNKTIGGNSTQGAAYVYTLAGGSWSQTAELTAADGAAFDRFGSSVALAADGTTALVGAYYNNTRQGAAYVYTRAGGTWSQTAKLIAADGTAGDDFGSSVALAADGTTALVGAASSYPGAAYVYTLASGSWSQTAKLTGTPDTAFGSSVALSGNGTTALVGAYNKTVGTNSYQGAAYVYTLAGGTWSQAAELTAADGAAGDRFGHSGALAADGTTALVGAFNKTVGSNSYQGAAYVYTLAGGTWSQAAELIAADGAASDRFGISVALSSTGTTALVGAYYKTVGTNSRQGAAYFFTGSDLSAVLSAPATVQAGAAFPSQYILTNASATASAALVVSLPLPATNAGYVSASASQGTCSYDSTAKVATCAVGSIPGNGGTASATLNLKATGAANSTIAQSGQLANASPDLAQTASTTIVPPPPSGGGGFGPFALLGLLALALLGGGAMFRKRRAS